MARKSPPPAIRSGFGSLADALRARGLTPTEAEPEPSAAPAKEPDPPPPVREERAGRILVRKETKGRGGKTVTTIQGLRLSGAARDAWITKLKARLGTGASLDGDLIVVQGDQQARVTALLAEEGL